MAEKESAINLALQFAVDQLEKLVDRQLDDALKQVGQSPDDKRMHVELSKCGSVQLQFSANRLNYSIPLEIRLTYDAGLTKLRGNGKVELDFETTYTIDEAWRLKTLTDLLTHRWIEEPIMKLIGLDLPISAIADYAIKRAEATVERTINKLADEQLELHTRLLQAWLKLQEPIVLNHVTRPVILLQAQHLGISQLVEKDRRLSAQFTLRGQPELHLGKAGVVGQKTPLPGFAFLRETAGLSIISMQSALPYTHAQHLARHFLLGKTLPVGEGRSLMIEQLDITQRNGRLHLRATTQGSFTGTIYVSGIPHHDAATDQLMLQQLNIDLKTDNLLHKTAAWALSGWLKKKIQSLVNEQFHEALAQLRQDLEKLLNDMSFLEVFSLRAEIKRLKLTNIELEEDEMQMCIQAEGYLGLLTSGEAKPASN
ncbi:MAG: DUF4403 family protein [Bacteroidota bacterium]